MNIPEIFGENVFNDIVMRSSLPKEVYKSLRKTIDAGEPIDMSIADTVANAMKDWALSKGATHYTHWFQPLTNLTAEKHDSFIEPCGGDGVIMQLTGKSLIVGEPTRRPFLRAAPAPPARRAAIRLGIPPLPPSSKRERSTFPPFSFPTRAKRWIKKRRF